MVQAEYKRLQCLPSVAERKNALDVDHEVVLVLRATKICRALRHLFVHLLLLVLPLAPSEYGHMGICCRESMPLWHRICTVLDVQICTFLHLDRYPSGKTCKLPSLGREILTFYPVKAISICLFRLFPFLSDYDSRIQCEVSLHYCLRGHRDRRHLSRISHFIGIDSKCHCAWSVLRDQSSTPFAALRAPEFDAAIPGAV